MVEESNKIRQYFSKKDITRVRHFMIGQKIGKGGYATVYKALQIFTKMEVAIKVVDLEPLSDSLIHRLSREIEIHRTLTHPNIVKIYEYFQQDSKMYIVMELIEGREIFHYLSTIGPFQQPLAAKLFHQLCQTVHYLHTNKIVHRDIKTQNIMLDSNFNLKLIDFGLAKKITTTPVQFLETCCGSVSYVAPQLLQRRKYDGRAVDVWCLGITLFVMLQACYPFDQRVEKVGRGDLDGFKMRLGRFSSVQALEIYKDIFKDSSERIKIEELLDSNYFKKYGLTTSTPAVPQPQPQPNPSKIQKISKMLNIDPNEVTKCIKQHKLSPSLCLYFLLLTQQQTNPKAIKPQIAELSPDNRKAHTLQIISRSQKLRKLGVQTPEPHRKFKTVQQMKAQRSPKKKYTSKPPIPIWQKKKKLPQQIQDSIFLKKCTNIFQQSIKQDHLKLRLRNFATETSKKTPNSGN